MTITKKKLIEVALPLEAINNASAREKSIRHGHPSTLHLWWARRPLAAARAVIFAQMVDDPSANPDLFPTEAAQEKERRRLFRIIEDLVLWENTTNETVIQKARDEIWQSWRRACAENADDPRAKDLFNRNKLPGFHDPFAGGGALPLEAQRLGLESYATDLNPVAVLINKAMIEIPPKFASKPPVNPQSQQKRDLRQWKAAQGLAEDVRYYGQWMREEAERRIGRHYPKVEITADIVKVRPDLKPYAGQKLTVIAWVWARTVKSPNPAFADVEVPLTTSFTLGSKPGKEAWVEPVIEGRAYRFSVKVGKPKSPATLRAGTKLARGANFGCVMSGTPIGDEYIKAESMAGRMGARLMAIVAEGERERIYLSPTPEHEHAASKATAEWSPDQPMNRDTRDLVSGRGYGFFTWADLFTSRQLAMLTGLSDLVNDAKEKVYKDAVKTGMPESISFVNGGNGAAAYADALAVILAFAVSKLTESHSTICTWSSAPKNELVVSTFRRQALPMTWDFAEANPFADSSGSIDKIKDAVARVVDLAFSGSAASYALQQDAATQGTSKGKVVSTDPPYYDNVAYADLSDFFYVWLRRPLRHIFPELFATMAVPKAEELVASSYRHGSKNKAEAFFLEGMSRAMHLIAEQSHPCFPVTIYYAFKQAESESETGTASTGWETFLDAVIRAGFAISGTWPARTERAGRSTGIGTNALASSIVLVCRPRTGDAPTATRREFVAALKKELPEALRHLQAGNIAPVDLAQAAIGPGMAVYTRYVKVLDAEGKKLPVRDALMLINQTLDEALAQQEGDFDADSRWALTWFEQCGFAEGDFGVASVLAQAKATGMNGLVEAGIIASGRGKVRLLRPDELPADWDPTIDARLTVWETVHHLIRALGGGGESAAADLVKRLGGKAEVARELAYRLYTLCERKKRTLEAVAYNGLVQSWPEIQRLAVEDGTPERPAGADAGLFDDGEDV